MSGSINWISDKDVKRVLTWDTLLKEVRNSLMAFTKGPDHAEGAIQPLRSRLPVQDKGIMLVMPAYVKSQGALATKILTAFPGNDAMNIPTHQALILLFHADTGAPAAILDGEVITEMRTAAASAVATTELVPKREGLIVAVLGAGAQGRSHARVMAHIYKNCKIRIWSRRPESAEALVSLLESESSIQVERSASVEEAVKNADIINNCTSTRTPILQEKWVKPGAHINSVGAPSPDWQEMEESLVRKATIYADSREAAQCEAGDIIKAQGTVYAEIGEVLLGTKPVRTDILTIYKSLGLAVEDAVSAQLVYNLLQEEKQL